jgi:hypothetical protein
MSELATDIKDNGFWNTFKERLLDLGNWIKELFIGSTVTEMTPAGPQEVRKEGLLEKLQEFVFGDELSRPGDSLYSRFVDWVGLNSRSDESLLSQVYNKILDAFLGKEVMVGRGDDRRLERQGGLFETMADAFINFWEGPTGTNLQNTIAGYFEQLVKLMERTFVNSWFARKLLGIDEIAVAEESMNKPGPVSAGIAENFGTIMSKALDDKFSNLTGPQRESAVGKLPEIMESMSVSQKKLIDEMLANQTWFAKKMPMDERLDLVISKLADTVASGEGTTEQNEILRDFYSGLRENKLIPGPDGQFANGTNGFQNFGSGTLAMLHNSEAVVPRKSSAGDLLQSFYDFQNKKTGSAVVSTPTSTDTSQSSLIKKVEELNTTMMRVAELLQNSVGLQEKTVKGVKGLGSDYYRGIGR